MIPVRLTMQGIYSYQSKPQTIEFGPLLDAGLFGIFGAVGSGKSSILEAISLALYGEIERLNKRDDRNYNMMNLKSDRLYIDFEFRNYTGDLFRFECEGRRNSKQFNEVNTYRRKASTWKDGEWVALDHADAETVTGLSYDNFKRTVIIPQGRFQEFLELTPGHRSQMLQDLFYLDRFDLAGATGHLISQNSEEIHRIEGRLTGFEEVTADTIKSSRIERDHLNEQMGEKSITLDHLKSKVTESTGLKQLHDQYEERQLVYGRLEKNDRDIRLIERELIRYQEARQDFSNPISQIKDKIDSISKLEKTRADMKDKAGKWQLKMEENRTRYDSLRKLTDDHPAQMKNAEEATMAGKLCEVKESLQHSENRIAKGIEVVQDFQNTIAAKEMEAEKMEMKIAAARNELQDRELLIELRNSYFRESDINTLIVKIKERMEEARQSILEKRLTFLEKNGFPSFDGDEATIPGILETHLLDFKRAIKEHRQNLSHLKVQAEMAHYVNQLIPGEPCPLCGATEHPAPARIEASSREMADAEADIVKLEKEIRSIEKAQHEWQALLNEKQQTASNIGKDKQEMKKLESSIDDLKSFTGRSKDKYPNLKQVEEALDSSGRVVEWVKKEENNLKNIRDEIKKATTDLEKYREKIGQMRGECDRLNGEAGALERNLSPAILNNLHQNTSGEWTSIAEELNRKIQSEKAEFGQVAQDRDLILQEYHRMTATLKTTDDFLSKERSELSQLESKLNQILSDSDFESMDEVRDILKKGFNVADEQKRIREHDREMHVVMEGMKVLKSQIGDRVFDGDAHDNLTVQYKECEREALRLRDQVNYLTKKLDESQKRLEEKEVLNRRLDGLQIRSENLKVLDGMFRAKKFVDYVSTVYLMEICDIANRRFRKLTNNHFALVLGEDNQFNVRDYLNDGQIRSVKTLSGGQMFQVSLCLALALAESLQNKSHSRQNFFFLDEGFGTLDGDALRLVLEALKSLRQEGRVVGVISHVESLQDEIDMFLHIHNDPQHGSEIRKSWVV